MVARTDGGSVVRTDGGTVVRTDGGTVVRTEKAAKTHEKDGPGPVMVSDTFCPAVHILGT